LQKKGPKKQNINTFFPTRKTQCKLGIFSAVAPPIIHPSIHPSIYLSIHPGALVWLSKEKNTENEVGKKKKL
jgi:hypothetical protein